jgi:hypothetical protein
MAEQAAHLVDHVLPHVPVRQWVLTLPYRLRYLLAYNHALCRARRSPSACPRRCGETGGGGRNPPAGSGPP